MSSTGVDNSTILESLIRGRDIHLKDCPICKTSRWVYFGGRSHFQLRVEYWICVGCTLVGQSPTFNDNTLREFYTSFYRQLYEDTSEPTADEYEFQKERGRRVFQILQAVVPKFKLNSILDFGCSVGGLLSVAQDEHNANMIFGVELDERHRRRARLRGIRVRSSLDEIRDEGLTFDVVTLVQVLEHIPDIVGLLSELRGLLTRDGYLCVEVPHSSQASCFEICHLWGFNESSMARLMQRGGFEVVSMGTHGFGHGMWRNPDAPERHRLNLVVVGRKSERISPSRYSSNAYRESLNRYLQMQPGATLFQYHKRLLRNTVKQLLGSQKQQLIAHSYRPTRLR